LRSGRTDGKSHPPLIPNRKDSDGSRRWEKLPIDALEFRQSERKRERLDLSALTDLETSRRTIRNVAANSELQNAANRRELALTLRRREKTAAPESGSPC